MRVLKPGSSPLCPLSYTTVCSPSNHWSSHSRDEEEEEEEESESESDPEENKLDDTSPLSRRAQKAKNWNEEFQVEPIPTVVSLPSLFLSLMVITAETARPRAFSRQIQRFGEAGP